MIVNQFQTLEKLLAKSPRNGRELSLEQHLRDTEDAAWRIFRLDGRWGQNWCRFFKLNDAEAQERFLLNLRVAALFHDIGKANEDFHRAVTEKGFVTQTLRHEHLSALLLCLPEVRQWLAQNSLLDADVITAAVLSHHLKAAESGEENKARGWKWCHPRGRSNSVQLYLQHVEVQATLDRIANHRQSVQAGRQAQTQFFRLVSNRKLGADGLAARHNRRPKPHSFDSARQTAAGIVAGRQSGRNRC